MKVEVGILERLPQYTVIRFDDSDNQIHTKVGDSWYYVSNGPAYTHDSLARHFKDHTMQVMSIPVAFDPRTKGLQVEKQRRLIDVCNIENQTLTCPECGPLPLEKFLYCFQEEEAHKIYSVHEPAPGGKSLMPRILEIGSDSNNTEYVDSYMFCLTCYGEFDYNFDTEWN